MKEVGARDRLVMAGLVVLGLVTVIAGVLSGRSTINYVLARDAREAALSWANELEKGLSEQGPHAPQLIDEKLDVLNADQFASQSGKLASLPTSSTSKNDFTLVEDLDRLTTGWVLRHMSDSQNEFVSKRQGFAVLGSDQAPLAVGGDLSPQALNSMLSQSDGKAALAQAIRDDAVATAAINVIREAR
jgi:hypothetical protein